MSTIMSTMEQGTQRDAQLQFIPDEIVFEILTRLPVRSLLKFKCVSKSWNSLISSPNFISTHLDTSSSSDYILVHIDGVKSTEYSLYCAKTSTKHMDLDPRTCDGMKNFDSNFYVYYTCNGLLLIISAINFELYIWNPSIRKIIRLPEGLYKLNKELITHAGFGFGFHHQRKDYKVVRIIRLQEAAGMYKTQLYSLRLNKWKDLAAVLPITFDSGSLNPLAIHVNGVLYWKLRAKDSTRYVVLSFDMDNEVYNSIELPEKIAGVDRDIVICVCAIENSLSVVHARQEGNQRRCDIWVMGLDTWNLIRTILIPLYAWPWNFSKDRVYIARPDENREFKTVDLYDPISQEAKEITRVDICQYHIWAIDTYKESLVLLVRV